MAKGKKREVFTNQELNYVSFKSGAIDTWKV